MLVIAARLWVVWIGPVARPILRGLHRDLEHRRPAAILDAAGVRAEPTAKTNMLTHLDPAAERTTSGVKRYVSFALASVTSGDGQWLCGSRREAQFDMESFILAGGTLYVLAQNERMASAGPVVSMFANEVFTAAESAALRLPARRRSERFVAVIDELRYGCGSPGCRMSRRVYGSTASATSTPRSPARRKSRSTASMPPASCATRPV